MRETRGAGVIYLAITDTCYPRYCDPTSGLTDTLQRDKT